MTLQFHNGASPSTQQELSEECHPAVFSSADLNHRRLSESDVYALPSTPTIQLYDDEVLLIPQTSTTTSPLLQQVQSTMELDSPIRRILFTSNDYFSINDDRLRLLIAIVAWYLIGVVAICTTKLLLANVPPLLLTFQQFLAASALLHARLSWCACRQPWPSEEASASVDFVLAGLFHTLDFLASNAAFFAASASFVETIKSCDLISTTAVALAWRVDRLAHDEGISLVVLVAGMLLSTWGNSRSTSADDVDAPSLTNLTRAAATVMTANFCFAFRAMSQKMYRKTAVDQMNDENLLCKMFQVGWMVMLVPTCCIYMTTIWEAIFYRERNVQLQYFKLAMINAMAVAIYKYV
jgi:hypothetical protein